MARKIVTRVTNGILYDDGCIRVDNVRASYLHHVKPWAKNEGEAKKYSMTGIAPKDTHKAVKDLIVGVMNKLLDEKNRGGKLGADKKFFRDGDLAEKPEYENAWTINASEREDRPPALRGRDGRLLTVEDAASLMFSGCYVNMLIRPWFQDSEKWGKRINANLIGIQFVKKGEPFGESMIDDEDAWDVVEDMDDDLDDDGEL